MTSGLDFNEEYGDVSDATRMLYLEPDMAAFAASRTLVAPPGTVFSYSSGTGVILSRLWMSRLGDGQAALRFPREALFGPLGMTSAVMEADEHGTFVGSSYTYATARDWARIGKLLLDDGVWNGKRLLPEGFVKMMGTSNGLPGGYSQLQTWVQGPHESEEGRLIGLPADTFWLDGHDGQTVAVIPSAHLVVVRLGLTPWKLDYWPEKLAKAIVTASAG
jgi:CubicO group peptidase (beta-lactamase class C family)